MMTQKINLTREEVDRLILDEIKRRGYVSVVGEDMCFVGRVSTKWVLQDGVSVEVIVEPKRPEGWRP